MPYSTNLYVIAAICGNFYQESTINPGIWEGLTVGAPGYGLGQWTDNPPTVMRRTALFNWLSLHGFSQDSGEGQLAFLIHENVWLGNGAGYQSAYSSLTDFLNSISTNLSDLTYEFFHQWEGIDDGTGPVRLQFAEDCLDRFQHDSGNRDPWYSSNSYNSIVHAFMNAYLVKDFFTGTSPTPPGPGPDPTVDELIAMLQTARKKKLKGGIFIAW